MQIGGMRAIGKMRADRGLNSFRSGIVPSGARGRRLPALVTSRRPQLPQFDLETRIPISRMADIVNARQAGRLLVQKMGLSGSRMTLLTTVISELARNILLYAQTGEIVLSQSNNPGQLSVTVAALDHGPGIENLATVMAGGYSTSGGLGLGLCGLRRIVDQFEIRSLPGKGTQVFTSIRV